MWSAALLAALVAGGTPAGSAVTEDRCATAGKTVRANAVARVFLVRTSRARIYYGCSRDTGRVHRIVRLRVGAEFVEHPRLTGRYFAGEYWHIDGHQSVIFVHNVRRTSETWAGVTGDDLFAVDVEVTRRGAVAWRTDYDDIGKCDRDGKARIGVGSRLRRIGRTIHWRSGGKRHSYRLRGRARRG